MKTSEAPRRHWGRRALALALIGGFVGWFVAYLGLLMLVQVFVRKQTGPFTPWARWTPGSRPHCSSVVSMGVRAGPPWAWSSGRSGSW